MTRRVLLTGAGGQLAAELAVAFGAAGDEVLALDRGALDIADGAAVADRVASFRPDLILNAAAYNRVDDAEDDAPRAFAVNALGPRHLARAARALGGGTVLVHYSTDYVFDGTASRPYREDDPTLPLGAYGVSKLAGEYFVRAEAPRHYVLRVSTVFGTAGRQTRHGNFVERMLALAAQGRALRVVADQVGCPSYAPDIAAATRALVEAEGPWGLYHCAGRDSCSFYNFARAIFAEAGLRADLAATTAAEYPTRARRPTYSALDSAKLAALGVITPRPWQEALAAYFARRVDP